MGDDIIKEVEDDEERLPTPPPISRRTESMLDEVPPEIPLRTVDRLELIEPSHEPTLPGQYDVIKNNNADFNGDMGESSYKVVPESSYEVVPDPNAARSVYEQPTPCKTSSSSSSSSNSVKYCAIRYCC